MNEFQNRYELRNRYLFEGQLLMQTALHIGGGKASLSASQSPIVLTPTGHPFIPGSSFKGSLRSTVEKLVPRLPAIKNLSSCALMDLPQEQQLASIEQKDEPISCPTVRQTGIRKIRRKWEQEGKNYDLEQHELPYLCSTCQLFGSPFTAARISMNDLYLATDIWESNIQIRDGVVIDRDSETAKDGLKYDFEVVPANTTFKLRLLLENPSPSDLQLICIGLSEFVHGFGMIGGKSSRGLGACILQKLTVSSLELVGVGLEESHQRFQNYLISRKFSTEREPGEQFLNRYINTLFEKKG